MSMTLDCSIITPERNFYDGKVNLAVVQAYDGEMGFLANHAPLISELGIGEVRLINDNKVEYVFIEGGIVEISNNKIIILAEKAFKSEELNEDDLEKRLVQLDETKADAFSYEKTMITLEKKGIKGKLQLISKIKR